MIIKINCKECKYKFITIATGGKIPEWIKKWLKKCTCPSCGSISWRNVKDFKPEELFNGFIGKDFSGGAIHLPSPRYTREFKNIK